MSAKKVRRADKAGTWYTGDGVALQQELDQYVRNANRNVRLPLRAIIGPHAGYSYSGPTAAYAYGAVDVTGIQRVFLLGPSHYKYLPNCAVTALDEYETPLGNITIDREVCSKLQDVSSGELFATMSRKMDEQEHSIELHLPYIYHTFAERSVKLVPIMVGSLSENDAEAVAQTLIPYFVDPANFFVFSSDFCHWGERFSYQYYDKSQGPIWKSIEYVDRLGMDVIETQSPEAFQRYMETYQKPTICGRNPIRVLLHMLHSLPNQFDVSFNYYDQSSKCTKSTDSSVSYVSGLVQPRPDTSP